MNFRLRHFNNTTIVKKRCRVPVRPNSPLRVCFPFQWIHSLTTHSLCCATELPFAIILFKEIHIKKKKSATQAIDKGPVFFFFSCCKFSIYSFRKKNMIVWGGCKGGVIRTSCVLCAPPPPPLPHSATPLLVQNSVQLAFDYRTLLFYPLGYKVMVSMPQRCVYFFKKCLLTNDC